MSQLHLSREHFDDVLTRYDASSEVAMRDFEAAHGTSATRPAVNDFVTRALASRRFARAADFGCNDGTFAQQVFAPRVGQLVLVDFSALAMASAVARLPRPLVRAALALDLTSDWKRLECHAPFDIISLCEVIQHMPRHRDRANVFRKAVALLRPKGLMLFSTIYAEAGEPREGFYRCDRSHHLLYWRRSDDAENAARFASAGCSVVVRFREEPTDAFVLQRMS